ncbi:MAG TPA: FAD-binding and (Fe-S)-binding domain-containing protein [Nitrolancea sp.]
MFPAGANINTQPWARHQTGTRSPGNVDLPQLVADLRASMRGEVRFSDGDRAIYSTDASNYRQIPIGAVLPRDTRDVIETISVCRRYGVPILSRGGGTSLAGQTCNTAVVLDFSKYMNQVLDIDTDQSTARVQPGLILDHLRAAADEYGLTFGPDPATHSRCTLGGMIGNNSCGVHSVMAGMTADNIESLEIITYDGLQLRVGPTSDDELEAIIRAGGRRGEIYGRLKRLRDRYADQIRNGFPHIPRRVSGYNLDQLLPENGFNVARALVGTEGTCVTVLEATVQLVTNPAKRALVILGYPDVYQSADHVPDVLRTKPIGLEGFDDRMIADMDKIGLYPSGVALLPEGHGWLLVEFGGDSVDEAEANARVLLDALKAKPNAPTMKLMHDPTETEKIWKVREAALAATAHVPGEAPAWPGWEDSAVPPEKLGDYLRDLRRLLDDYDYTASFYGHFGQGCIHMRIDFDLLTQPGIDKYQRFMEAAADLVLDYGGSLSGEHGDGQSRAELLPKMFGPELIQAFREFKAIWDPSNKMNPGKVVEPNPMSSNLRLGTSYHPREPKTHFSFVDDNGSFAQATRRCVGVGACRRTEGGVMCPSFMVTREEEHSTRGRARLLFEMLEGEEIDGGWRDENVKGALDLCLACKGCKGDCPVNVDMATYKAEFLSHYFHRRLRPRSAYAMGLIMYWSRIAARAPLLVNLLTQSPLTARIAKFAAGIAPERRVPGFANQTFVSWFRGRPPRNVGGPRVMLWPDTFNNHFHPKTAQAAVEVLESGGYQVLIPDRWVCCGRPFYDFGMLDQAEHALRQVIDTLRPAIEAGIPVVGLEPSCVSVFRDDMHNLLPYDEDAKRLYRQTYLLSEFLDQHVDQFDFPRLERKAIVHGHCHHHAIMKLDAEERVLQRLGLDYELLDSGCCGMAGAFGFERGEHYDVSVKAGERVLLPAVRAAADETLLIANGFSCREQIAQGSDRRALHLAEVVQLALRQEKARGRPERDYADDYAPSRAANLVAAGAGVALLAGSVFGLATWIRRHA